MSVAHEMKAHVRAVRSRLWRPHVVRQIEEHKAKQKEGQPRPAPAPRPAPRDVLLLATGLPPKNFVRDIKAEVAAQLGVSVMDMVSNRREAKVAFARHFAMWRCRHETPVSLPQIGRAFGGRDHTTVMSAVRKMDRLYADGTLAKIGLVR